MGTTEDEMIGWHHRLDGLEFEQTPGVGDGQRSLACCSPRGRKELDTTEQLNWIDWHGNGNTAWLIITGLENTSFCSSPKEGQCQRNIQTTAQLHSFQMLAKKSSKFSKLGFNSTWTEKFQVHKLYLKKLEEQEIKLPTSLYHRKSKRIAEKYLLQLHWLHYSFWLCGSHQTVENFSRDRNNRPSYLPPEKPLCKMRSNS